MQHFFSPNTGIEYYKFPLRTASAASHKFWYVVFSFSFCEKCCLVPLLVDSFTHGLFRSVLVFSFKIFGGFSEIFLLLKEHFLLNYWFLIYFCCGQRTYSVEPEPFQYTETCFMTQNMVYLGIFRYTREKDVCFAVSGWSVL